MEKEKIVPAVLILGFVAGAFLISMDQGENKSAEVQAESVNSSEIKKTSDGTKYTVHPDKLIQGCPGGMDCIPSIDNPNYESADEAGWMSPGDKVIALERNGESLAFPLRILDSHEIVNTEIGGEPIVVTYCPLCRSGVTYSREVGGEVLEFGVSGKLRNANLVMYDRGSETYWSQIGGKAIVGPRTGQELDLMFSSITNWSQWRNAHPDTKVLSRNTGIYPPSSYESRDYLRRGYDNPEAFGASGYGDQLNKMEIVHGIESSNGSKAYPDSVLNDKKLIQDRVGGEPVLIMKRPDDGSVIAFSREVEGEILNLSLSGNRLRDAQGREWRLNGERVGEGPELKVLTPRSFYWFAWSKFHPKTQVYKQSEARK